VIHRKAGYAIGFKKTGRKLIGAARTVPYDKLNGRSVDERKRERRALEGADTLRQ